MACRGLRRRQAGRRAGDQWLLVFTGLQADSPYYYQITCGSATVSGSFTTANIALGNTYD
jgi:hypothetical protein